MTEIRTIIFDLDDTLIETGDLFRASLRVMYDTVVSRLNGRAPSDDSIYALQNDIDAKLMGRSGVKPERFSQSLVDTYRAVLKEQGVAALEDDEKSLFEAGLDAFRRTPEMSPGSEDVLAAFSDRELLMYTWGHPEIQRPRIDALELGPRFSEVHIVLKKDREALERVVGERDPKETLVCGDSLKNEILPATEIGCHAVHLERADGWAYLHTEVDANVKYHRIAAITELPDLVARIEH